MNGWGFYTLYGLLRVGDEILYGNGDPVHYRCQGSEHVRVIAHDPYVFGESNNARRYTRTMKIVAPGIMLQLNGRYSARFNKKRLGTYPTLDEAEAARSARRAQLEAGRAKRMATQKTKTSDQPTQPRVPPRAVAVTKRERKARRKHAHENISTR